MKWTNFYGIPVFGFLIGFIGYEISGLQLLPILGFWLPAFALIVISALEESAEHDGVSES